MKTVILEDSNLFADNFLSFIAERMMCRRQTVSDSKLSFQVRHLYILYEK